MEKLKGRSLHAIHRNPLPITLSVDHYGQLPAVIPHNPLSWAYLWYRMALIYIRLVPQRPKIVVSLEDGLFKVRGDEDMMVLWNDGFFGKGTLSRSDPSWKKGVHRRLKLDGATEEATKEEITKVRRDERKKFKELRAKYQHYEAMARQKTLTETDVEEWEKIKLELVDAKVVRDDFKVTELKEIQTMRQEDLDLIVDGKLKEDLEFLQLQRTEAFFLVLLDVVDVVTFAEDKDNETSKLSYSEVFKFCAGDLQPDSLFILDYVVYHHFRSMGWCVRSGIKFGCDMLLYKRGPPFMHAEYSVLVIPNGKPWKSWEDILAVGRVVGGVKKTLVLVYVDFPSKERFNEVELGSPELFVRLFQLYKVTEVVYRRWIPSRTRD